MLNELHAFVKEALEKGQDRSAIQQALLQAGWREEEVKKALGSFAQISFPVPVPKPKPYLQAREAFLYLISFIALYITAFSFGVLVFAFIDKWLPDALQFRSFSARGLTTALASIIIAFPLYLFMTRLIGKMGGRDSERGQSKVGKWLTYITLVVAAAIIIGDLIAVLSGLLSGELTTRFFVKALTILAITGSIFGYYLWSLQREEKEKEGRERQTDIQEKSLGPRVFVGVVMSAIVSVAVYGLILVGTPASQRLIQFDDRRVSDLRQITFAIDAYWERNEHLPDTLEDLRDPRYFGSSTLDPKTDEPYEYRSVNAESYELCATFEVEYMGDPYSRIAASESFWFHDVGRTCFTLEIQEPVKEQLLPIPIR